MSEPALPDTAGLIRRATEADVPAILDLYNDAILHTTATWDHDPVDLADRRRWLRAHNTDPNVTLVAEVDGAVVGFAGYGEFRGKLGWAATVEHSVYLSPAAQGRGLGRRLLTDLISAARDRHVHVMVGVLSADNEVSLRLHRSLGFAEVARMPEVGSKFGRWLDAVMVQLVLDERARPADPVPAE